MTTAEISKEWGCEPRWVRDRCKEGMIPLAEKNGLQWNIPEEADKPPCTRHYAVTLLKTLLESEKGITVNFFPGKDTEKAIQAYRYLSEWAFISEISSFDRKMLHELLKIATITERGLDLINTERGDSKEYDKKTTIQKITADIGPLGASYDVTKEKQL